MSTISVDAAYRIGYHAYAYYAQLIEQQEFFGGKHPPQIEVVLIPMSLDQDRVRMNITLQTPYHENVTYFNLDIVRADEISAYVTSVKALFTHHHHDVNVVYRPELEKELR